MNKTSISSHRTPVERPGAPMIGEAANDATATGRPIRVLLLRPDPRQPGGVVNYYTAIAGKSADHVQISTFVVGRRPGLLGSKLLYPLQLMFDIVRLAFTVLVRRYDVYHLNPSLNRAAYVRDHIFMRVLALLGRGRTLVFFRGWEDDYFAAIKDSAARLRRFLWFCNKADHILVLASSIRNDLVAVGISAEKVTITSTTFDGSILSALDAGSEPDPGKRPFIFLFMSRLLKEKGVAELIEAAAMLRDQGHQFKLVLAGAGPFEEAARQAVSAAKLDDWVDMPGYIGAAVKGQALLSADVFVFPTYHGEGCPNCVLEAMGAGLPVISTRVGGIPDVIHPPQGGILLADTQPATIAEAMLDLMTDEPRRRALSDGNRKVAWERYESRGVARFLDAVYVDLSLR